MECVCVGCDPRARPDGVCSRGFGVGWVLTPLSHQPRADQGSPRKKRPASTHATPARGGRAVAGARASVLSALVDVRGGVSQGAPARAYTCGGGVCVGSFPRIGRGIRVIDPS